MDAAAPNTYDGSLWVELSTRQSTIPKLQRQLIEKKTRDLFTKLNDFAGDKSKRFARSEFLGERVKLGSRN